MTEELERLKEENEKLKNRIKEYEKREKEIAEKEHLAKIKADEIISSAEKLFDLEADRLRLFKIYWDRKFSKSFSDDERIKKLNDLAVKIDEIIKGEGKYLSATYDEKTDAIRKIVGEDEKLIGDKDIFIGDGEDGFSMSEILNPSKEQNLSEILKEMGIE